ncbi:MAG: hypothetical protein H5U24_19400 [Thioclava marina]|nr:hypothetical protein [Thioclava marina]
MLSLLPSPSARRRLGSGPVSPEADKKQTEEGHSVVPDILTNSGGVTASHPEWVQNRSGFY